MARRKAFGDAMELPSALLSFAIPADRLISAMRHKSVVADNSDLAGSDAVAAVVSPVTTSFFSRPAEVSCWPRFFAVPLLLPFTDPLGITDPEASPLLDAFASDGAPVAALNVDSSDAKSLDAMAGCTMYKAATRATGQQGHGLGLHGHGLTGGRTRLQSINQFSIINKINLARVAINLSSHCPRMDLQMQYSFASRKQQVRVPIAVAGGRPLPFRYP